MFSPFFLAEKGIQREIQNLTASGYMVYYRQSTTESTISDYALEWSDRESIMTRVRLFGWMLPATAALVFVSADHCCGQSVVLRVAGHQKLEVDNRYTPFFLALDQHPTYGFEVYFNSILRTKRAYRLGVGLTFSSIEGKLKEPYSELPIHESLDYRVTTLLLSLQRKVLSNESVYFLANLSAGVAFKKAELEISNLSAKDDYICFSIQPGICYILRLYRNIGIQLFGRYNFFTGKKQDLYPFSPGFFAGGGMLFELPIGE